MNEENRGAVIYIPSGDYHLKTQVKIDISYFENPRIRTWICDFNYPI